MLFIKIAAEINFRRGNNETYSNFVMVGVMALFARVAHAQNHGEVGAFVDYFRLQDTRTNFVGVGGRAAVSVAPYVQIEAEMAYDFDRAFTEGFTNTAGTVTLRNSNMRVLHGLFGPKLQTKGPVRVFVTVKVYKLPFRSLSRFPNGGSRNNNVGGTLPGGVEAFLGPIGLRAEVGDEIIFSNGAHHNWKITLGPQIRF